MKNKLIGLKARLNKENKDRRWTTIRAVTKCGTGITLEEQREGFYNWNIGDLEIDIKKEYEAANGTLFKFWDGLGKDIEIFTRNGARLPEILADCIEFGGMHGIEIHPKLIEFAGYDCIGVEIMSNEN